MNKNKKPAKLTVLVVTSIHPDFDARVWRHARSLASIGYTVHLICPWKVADKSIKDGVIFHTFKSIEKRWQRPFLVPIRVLKKVFLLLNSVNIIHFHDLDLLPFFALLSPVKPVVYDVHENYPLEMLSRNWIPEKLRFTSYLLVKYGQKFFSQIIKNVVLVTPDQVADFSGERIRHITLKNYASIPAEGQVEDNYQNRRDSVIFIGSHYESNGSLLILDIAEAVTKKNKDVIFYIADRFSSKVYRERWLSEVSSRNLGFVIHLLPNVLPIDIIKSLNKATIAINPVLRVEKQIKAINSKLFEFMAAGLPFVTSDLPYPCEIVEETSAGLLAQPENVNSFADAILHLVDDRKKAFEMGQKGRKAFSQKYSWESQLEYLTVFYQEIIVAE